MANAGREAPSKNDPQNPRPPGMDAERKEIPWASPAAQGKDEGAYGGDLNRGFKPMGGVNPKGSDRP